MRVNEIFYSIEGEGIRAGVPCVFIRLYGCNLKCSYCDTRYSCENSEYTEMTVDEIIDKVLEFDCKNVTVTGGEPLIHENIDELLRGLLQKHFNINVETNGTVEPYISDITYTVDFKTKSSGMSDKMNINAFTALDDTDVIKFVVGSIEDLEQAEEFVHKYQPLANIFVSPIFGKIEPKEIAEYLKDHHLNDWRLQLQIHKFIWEPTKRGV